ncbi:hypothetical protein SORBI_3009G152800 [Sorghum bicolor]|uniref:Major facilitator superfamily (MFS) profile domain-containing protein n=1 Tax=Sorghum bicolor TaxID=4558 RepID=C5YYP0_SORBI|nr:hypothetical protein SORBI_3009G152800 [Sorghum bicolor]
MALGGATPERQEPPRRYSGRITAFVVLSCVAAGMGGVIFGYDIGVSGGVSSMDAFLERFFPEVYRRMKGGGGERVSNYCRFDSQLLTAFTSSLYVAGLVSTFFASSVTARCGRRPSMIVAGVVIIAGAAIGGSAVHISMLILSRVLLGVGLGFGNQAVPLYLSEMAPPSRRGAFSNGFQLCVGLGSLAAQLTPNSLVQQGRDRDQVRDLLRKIRGGTDRDNKWVEDEVDDMVAVAARSSSSSKLVMAVMIPFFQQVTGINAIAFYAPELLRTVGVGESAALLAVVAKQTVGVGATLASMFAVDRFGRRTLFLAGGLQMLVSQVLIGGIMASQLGDDDGNGEVSKACAVALIALIAVYQAGFGWSWGPLGWLVPNEIFPLEVRSAGQSIAVAVNFLLTTAVAQSFLAVLCHLNAGIFFFFAAWLVIMTVFVYLFLPETKGLPIEQVDRLWAHHWFWNKFVETNHQRTEEQSILVERKIQTA